MTYGQWRREVEDLTTEMVVVPPIDEDQARLAWENDQAPVDFVSDMDAQLYDELSG
jgi:hypothetical protein